MKKIDLVIIGGGSAGMAAAIGAREAGIQDILILERERELGGILNQCIHNGFGLHYFNEELTGPSYASRWVKKIQQEGIDYRTETHVTSINQEKEMILVSEEGYEKIQAKAVVFATGCHERTRGNLAIPGYRPTGVWTAGTAQRYVNLDGLHIGKKVVILGSGDIGLIMARRMSLEGAKVLAVLELHPNPGGLPRNVQQCLMDFDIPLYLSHTVTNIHGRERLEAVTVAQVDRDFRVIKESERTIYCDTLLLSVGLIPESQLMVESGMELLPQTKSVRVDQGLQTEKEGFFVCGNALHVHDIVDFVSEEGLRAGKAAAAYLLTQQKGKKKIQLIAGEGLNYLLPSYLSDMEEVQLDFRSKSSFTNASIEIMKDGVLLKSLRRRRIIPAEMEHVKLSREDLAGIKENIEVRIRA